MTLCAIGDAVQPFAATFPQPLAQGAISFRESRHINRLETISFRAAVLSLQSPFGWRPKGRQTRRKRRRLAARRKPQDRPSSLAQVSRSAGLAAYWQASQKPCRRLGSV
jgi:hypothetical protein